jgi:hypothetical protein
MVSALALPIKLTRILTGANFGTVVRSRATDSVMTVHFYSDLKPILIGLKFAP